MNRSTMKYSGRGKEAKGICAFIYPFGFFVSKGEIS